MVTHEKGKLINLHIFFLEMGLGGGGGAAWLVIERRVNKRLPISERFLDAGRGQVLSNNF